MIIYYTYTVISTILTIFKNFSSSFHDNVLHQGKTPFKCLYCCHTRKYCDERFLCYNGDMSINFLSIFSELNCFAYAQIHVRVAYLFLFVPLRIWVHYFSLCINIMMLTVECEKHSSFKVCKHEILKHIFYRDINQPRTQALHCFYRDQWQLINAKHARVLGQHAKKPSAQGC